MSFIAITYIIGVLVFLILSAFFSGMETASISANKARLQHLEMKGNERAAEILKMISDIQHVIAVVLVGNNICLVLASLFGRKFFTLLLPESTATFLWGTVTSKEVINLVILTPLFLIFAEILPKQIFRQKSTKMLLLLGKPLHFFEIIFLPIIKIFNAITIILFSPFGIRRQPQPVTFTKDDLLRMIGSETGKEPENGKPSERDMIRRIFGLEKTLTREGMKPINDVIAIRLGKETVNSVIELAGKTGFSRFPVYKDKVINLIGYVDIYHLLRSDLTDKRLEDFICKAYYVPETKPLDDLLEQFLKRGEQMAIVVDEFGACSGWITLEDVIEEVVGEIEDEFDRIHIDIIEEAEHTYVMEAVIDLDDLNHRLGLSLPKEGYETLGGLIQRKLGEIPSQGQTIDVDNVRLEIISMDGLRIGQVRLVKKPS